MFPNTITKINYDENNRMCISDAPDKMCDRISDAILDLHLSQDPNSRCAVETCGGLGEVYITGEVTSEAVVTKEDIIKVVHQVTTDNSINVIINLNTQSPEIAQGVDIGRVIKEL